MVIYQLEHAHGSTDEYCGCVKMLGLYSSLEMVVNAIEKYRNICGFSLFKNGFFFIKRYVECEDALEYVYFVELYMHDKEYDFEHGEFMQIFASEEDANKYAEEADLNRFDFAKGGEIEYEITVSKYKINEMEWRYGFDFD